MASHIPLRVLVSEDSTDKKTAHSFRYKYLSDEEWIDSWVRDLDIRDALKVADAVLIILTSSTTTSEGYITAEIAHMLDIVDEKPDGSIKVIVVRLEEQSVPGRMRRFQYLDCYKDDARDELKNILRGLYDEGGHTPPNTTSLPKQVNPDFYKFIKLERNRKLATSYSYWIGKYPVTVAQYARFLSSDDYGKEEFWRAYLKFGGNQKNKGRWHDQALHFLKEEQQNPIRSPDGVHLEPLAWNDLYFGHGNSNSPVVGISWFEANAYANWLLFHWHTLAEGEVNKDLKPQLLRLPLEGEWLFAAQGEEYFHYPWGTSDPRTTSSWEQLRIATHNANIKQSHNWQTTPVNAYPGGASSYGVMDLVGNVWEWQANSDFDPEGENDFAIALKGGGWNTDYGDTGLNVTAADHAANCSTDIGFRLVAIPIAE